MCGTLICSSGQIIFVDSSWIDNLMLTGEIKEIFFTGIGLKFAFSQYQFSNSSWVKYEFYSFGFFGHPNWDKDNILSRKLIFFGCFVLLLLLFCPFVLLCICALCLADGVCVCVSMLKANCKNFAIFFFCWLNLWLDFWPIPTLDLIRLFVVVIIKREKKSVRIHTCCAGHMWMAIEWLLPLSCWISKWVFAAWQECDSAICYWPRAWNKPSTKAIYRLSVVRDSTDGLEYRILICQL